MKGTIRLITGMALLIAAASVNDTLPDLEFLMWSLGLAVPGAIIGFSGARALNLANQS
jgi:hypothetical protein